jgi:hypothetical protein
VDRHPDLAVGLCKFYDFPILEIFSSVKKKFNKHTSLTVPHTNLRVISTQKGQMTTRNGRMMSSVEIL